MDVFPLAGILAMEGPGSRGEEGLKVLELFSGIGGMRVSPPSHSHLLSTALFTLSMLAAVRDPKSRFTDSCSPR